MKKFIQSVLFALNGIWFCLRTQNNTKIQFAVLLIIAIIAKLLNCNMNQCIILFSLITMVIATEFINTAIEELCNVVCQQQNQQIKIVKDVAAAAVLLLAIVSSITCALIFYHQFNQLYATGN
jgi:diacylglycerol kinase (ATP)